MAMSTTSDDTPRKQGKTKKGDRSDPSRFLEPGINYKGKLIGVEDVPEPRGDKMCQVAMAKLKAAVKTIGDHKQKIVVNVSIEGVKIIDEKTDLLLHFHPVHRISFISRDVGDSRAFGYVYGVGNGSHQFYGIKTEKVAEGIVMSLRDLFQIVFEMKKQEAEAHKKIVQIGDQPQSSRGFRYKSEYQAHSDSCHVTLNPVGLKKGVTAMSDAHHLHTMPASVMNPVQKLSQNTGTEQRSVAITPEPIYQNVSVLSGRPHFHMQTLTSSTPPPCPSSSAKLSSASFATPTKSGSLGENHPLDRTLLHGRKWVSFDLGMDDSGSERLGIKKVVKKDPFANDPFFNQTPGCEDITDVAVWTEGGAQNIIRPEKLTPGAVESVYGCFVEPSSSEHFANFSYFQEKSDAWNPAPKVDQKPPGHFIIPGGRSLKDAVFSLGKLPEVSTPETPSERESFCDAISFPSPNTPPPPLPCIATISFGQPAPVIPPRPGFRCSGSETSTDMDHRVANDDGIPSVPPPPPPRSDLCVSCSPVAQEITKMSLESSSFVHRPQPASWCQPPGHVISTHPGCNHQDPFAVAFSKRTTKPAKPFSSAAPNRAATAPNPERSSELSLPAPDLVLPSLFASFDSLQDNISNSKIYEKSNSLSKANNQLSFDVFNYKIHDPFMSLDQLLKKNHDPFASNSDRPSLNNFSSDPFGKQNCVDSYQFQTQAVTGNPVSESFDDVFSSKDGLDENAGNGPQILGFGEQQSPSRAKKINSTFQSENCENFENLAYDTQATQMKTSLQGCRDYDPRRRRQVEPSVGSFHSGTNGDTGEYSESNFDKQSSFDSLMDDFVRRFPPFDESWLPFSKEEAMKHSDELRVGSQQSELHARKSNLNIPKSSDSSSNSEIAEAFVEDRSFSPNHSSKQPTHA